MHTPPSDPRPEADARVRSSETVAGRGRLKIFLGAYAGAGKTWAMLDDARMRAKDGVDVVVGHVNLRGDSDAAAQLDGLAGLPSAQGGYRNPGPTELDLDAALARRPQLLLVDELAHDNPAGARHARRWQDVEELLAAGIDVYATLNVQHLESLNDTVAQITGVRVGQTVPDRTFDGADEVELIDLPPADLIARLREGRVHVSESIPAAAEGFFREGNLIALRQLALRTAADRVDSAMRDYRELHAIRAIWPVGERLLVCVGPDAASTRLVRTARRIAAALHAQWFAVYVETPTLTRLPQAARDRILATLTLAARLGAETANLSGEHVSTELLAFANRHNIIRMIVGKPARRGWRTRVFGSLADALIRHGGAIDVYVVNTQSGPLDKTPLNLRWPARRASWPAYLKGVGVIMLATLLCLVLQRYLEPATLIMVYLLATVLVATAFGSGPSALAALLGVGLFDFLFVTPRLSFAVSDTQYAITFLAVLATVLIISHLAARGRRLARVARGRERRAAQLYALSRELAASRDLGELGAILRRHALAAIDGEASVLLPDADGRIQDPEQFCGRGLPETSQVRYPIPGNDLGIAQWAFDHRQPAGINTDTLATADAIFLPLHAQKHSIGVLALRPRKPRQLGIPEQRHLLDALVSQAAVAMERVQLARDAQDADVRAETKHMRGVVFNAIAHDFSTPLATITDAATTLRDSAPGALDSIRQRNLLDGQLSAAQRMKRLLGELLELDRLNAGGMDLERSWLPIGELVDAALARLHAELAGRPVNSDIPANLPLVPCNGEMIGQVLEHLIENALHTTPARSAIDISARVVEAMMEVRVRDHAPGLAADVEQRVSDGFLRGRPGGAHSAFDIGLTLCKYLVEAHGGTIGSRHIASGGAEFHFSLPLHVIDLVQPA